MEALLVCILIALALTAFFNHCHKETIMFENEDLRRKNKELESRNLDTKMEATKLKREIENYEQVIHEYDKTISVILRDTNSLDQSNGANNLNVQIAILNQYRKSNLSN